MKLFSRTPSSVDQVMAAFSGALAGLQAVADTKSARVAEIEQQEAALKAERQAAEAEVVRAAAMSQKLSKLLGV